MKIGIMLRHMGQHGGGVSVYTRHVVSELLAIESVHEFLLIYSDPRHVGTFGDGPRVREVAVGPSSRLLWDHVAVPWVARREHLDVLYNPKYSVPLGVSIPVVFVCHGLNDSVDPRWSKTLDRWNRRYFFPLYFAKAARVIAVSESTRSHVLARFNTPEHRVQTIHSGVGEAFGAPLSEERRSTVSSRYRLPERYYLYCGQIYPPKNFGRLIRAYARVGPRKGIHLVVAGEHTWLSESEIAEIDRLDLSSWVVWAGWVDHDALPVFYALAEALVLPSLYEAFPLPIAEAMASGCPVLTSDRYGMKEVAGDAALLIDPENVDCIADGLARIVEDDPLRRRLITAGRERAGHFSWERCAVETLRALEAAVPNQV